MPDLSFTTVPNSHERFIATSLADVCHWRGIHQADRVAYRFLHDGLNEAQNLTYGQLLDRVQGIASRFDGEPTGARAVLLFPSGFDYIASFYACLYAGIIAVPAYPILSYSDQLRLRVILDDCQPRYILTTCQLRPSLLEWFHKEGLNACAFDIIAVDEPGSPFTSVRRVMRFHEVAFLQYTSGSTGHPKGVVITHQNLLHNSALIHQKFEHDATSSVVSWLPPFHDMGLVGGILQPLFAGFCAMLMSPMSFLRRPLRWLQAISRYGASSSGGPNFAYALCIKHFRPPAMESVDLSSWRVAFNGAEPVRAQTLTLFTDLFAPYGFRHTAPYPCYGLAEATLFVTGGSARRACSQVSLDREQLAQGYAVHAPDNTDTLKVVGVGQPLGSDVRIVDPMTHVELPEGQIGEVWVSGTSVAQGYWQRPEASQETFHATLQGAPGAFMRTGDLGFVDRQDLFITGRLKDVIILNGKKYFPSDIEQSIQSLSTAFKADSGAAFSIDAQGEQLVVVQEIERVRDSAASAEALEHLIRAHCFTVHGIRPYDVICTAQGHLPKTTSGKIKRLQIRQDYLHGKFQQASA
jgi:acyl-CoA synthetase (AMP-forming)/AMP-acid ligase II